MPMSKFRKEVDEFRKLNGNNVLSNKDMLMYLVNKQDKFETYVREKFDKGTGKISEANTGVDNIKTYLKYSAVIGMTLLSSILGWIILEIIKLKTKLGGG